MIKAVVFDWAGTLVDYGSMAPATIMQRVFEEHGVYPPLSLVRQHMGLDKKEHIQRVLSTKPMFEQWEAANGELPTKDDTEILYNKLESKLESDVAEFSYPIPGILNLLDYLRSDGIKIGSTTGYSSKIMNLVVPAAFNSGIRLDSVVCVSDVSAGRPYPWMCYQNAMNLNVYPMSSMVKIGDTITDVQEGMNAGMWTIAIVKSGNEIGLSQSEIQTTDPRTLKQMVAKATERFVMAGADYVVEEVSQIVDALMSIESRIRCGEIPNHLYTKPSLV